MAMIQQAPPYRLAPGKISPYHQGNKNLRSEGVRFNITSDQILEIAKCKNDIEYFCNNYVKIVHVDHGIVNFNLRDYQKRILNSIDNNRFTICKMPRQSGKSTTIMCGKVLHYILFNSNKTVVVCANKQDLAIELLGDLKHAYQLLPIWMQKGVVEWAKKTVVLENGSEVFSEATSANSARGRTVNLLVLDEFAHVSNTLAQEFFASAYPVISSGTTTKVVIVSTPKGLNHFHKLWTDAEKKKNSYVPVSVHWSDVPGRTEEWKNEEIANTSQTQFDQEQNCVTGDTRIVVKDTDTGEVMNISIEELYEYLNV